MMEERKLGEIWYGVQIWEIWCVGSKNSLYLNP